MAQLTLDEFAESIKSKYPEYADRDNTVLAKAMLEKYPEYADRVSQQPTIPADKTTASAQSVLADLQTGRIDKPTARERLKALRPTAEQYGGVSDTSLFGKIKRIMTAPEAKAEAPGILGGGTPTLDYLGSTLGNVVRQGAGLIGGITDAATRPVRQIFSPIENRPLASGQEIVQRVKEIPSQLKSGTEGLIKGTAESFGVKMTPEEGLKINPYISQAKLKREPINTVLDLYPVRAGGKALYSSLKRGVGKEVIEEVTEKALPAITREQAREAAAKAPVKTYKDILYNNSKAVTAIPYNQLENPRFVQVRGNKLGDMVERLKDTHIESVNTLLKENADEIINVSPKLNTLYKELEQDNLGSFVTEKVVTPRTVIKNKYGLPEVKVAEATKEVTKFKLDPLFNKPKTGQVVNALPAELAENQGVLNSIIDELNAGGITVQKADRLRKILDTQIKWGKDLVVDNAARKIRTLLSTSIADVMPEAYSKKMMASHLTLQDYKPFFKGLKKAGGGSKFAESETFFSNKGMTNEFKNIIKKYSGLKDTKEMADMILGELDTIGAWHDWNNYKLIKGGNVLPGVVNRNIPLASITNDLLAKGITRAEYEFIKQRYARQLGRNALNLLKSAITDVAPKAIKQIPKGVKIQEDILNNEENQ